MSVPYEPNEPNEKILPGCKKQMFAPCKEKCVSKRNLLQMSGGTREK